MKNNIKNRILSHFANGNTLSVRNMYLVSISNVSREIRRNFEDTHNITCNRRKVNWNFQGTSGYFFEYSIDPSDMEKVKKIREDLINSNLK